MRPEPKIALAVFTGALLAVWYDNAQKPVLTIKPGDTVIMETMMHYHDRLVPGATLDMLTKIRLEVPGRGAHTLTGPIYVEGAEPGDVRISEVVDIVKGTFCFNPKDARARPPAALPSNESATDYVTVGRNADLNKAMDVASMAMINLLSEKRQLDRLDAYGLASVAMDCRIAPPTGSEVAVHCLTSKSLWRSPARRP